MADQCEVIEEQGFLTDTMAALYARTLSESGVFSDLVFSVRSFVLGETGVLADTIFYHRIGQLAEVCVGHDTATPLRHPVTRIAERGRARDSLRVTRSYRISEEAEIADTIKMFRAVVITEEGVVSALAIPVRHGSATIRELARIADSMSYSRVSIIIESGALSDSMTALRSISIGEEATVADVLIAAGVRRETISELAIVHDQLRQVLHARMTISEELFVDDANILPGAGSAWTANTDTWAMSRYTSQPFNSIVAIDGVLYGAGAEGLYRLDADDDGGVDINAGIDLVESDLGSPQIKALGYAYAGMKCSGRMLLNVRSSAAAKRVSYTYRFEDRIYGNDRGSTRAKIGKGIESRYWQIGLRNEDGSDFSIDDLQVMFDLRSKKV